MTARATSEETVRQVVDGDHEVTLRKQIWTFLPDDPTGREVPLVAVRKTLPTGPTRGPVVLVHGFAQNRYSWHLAGRSISGWLAERGWDTWNLELRGHGRSHQGATPATFSDYVVDVARVARHFQGRAAFVGHSLGATAIYAAAGRAPMAGIVGIGGLYTFATANPLLRGLSIATHQVLRPVARPHVGVRTRLLGRVLSRMVVLADTQGYLTPASGWWPGTIERHVLDERLRRGFDWEGSLVWLDMARWGARGTPFDLAEGFRASRTPLLVIAGDRDHLCPPDDARGAYLASAATDKTWLLMDLADHGTHWGHLDLVLGRRALQEVWPRVHAWLDQRLGGAAPSPTASRHQPTFS